MHCTNCGEEVRDGMKYCPNCGHEVKFGTGSVDHGSSTIFNGNTSASEGRGSQISIKPVEEKKNKKNKKEKQKGKKGKKVKRILCAVIAVILIVGISGVVFYIKSPARQIVSQVKKGEYTTVQKLYDSGVKDKFVQEMMLQKLVEKDCDTIVDEFKTNKISYDEANKKIEAYESLGDKKIADYLSKESKVLDDLNTSIESYAKAEKLYESGKYAEALEKYALVVEEDDNYKDAQEKLSKCVESYREEILNKTENPGSQADYESAIDTLNIALKIVPDDEKLTARLDELETGYADLLKSEALTNGTQYIQDGKFEELFELLSKACEKNSGDTELENLKKTAEDEFVKKVQTIVDGYVANDDYEDAILCLNDAIELCSDNQELQKMLENIEAEKPYYLLEVVDPYETPMQYEDHEGSYFEMGGEKYTHGFTCMGYGDKDKGNLTYFNINGKYKELSYIAGIVDNSGLSNGNTVVFSIIADGTVVDTCEMKAGDLPVSRNVSIKGCKQLVISVYSHQSTAFYDGIYGLADIKVK